MKEKGAVDKADPIVQIQGPGFRENLLGKVPAGLKTREQLRQRRIVWTLCNAASGESWLWL